MNILKAYGRGFKNSLRHPRMIVLIFAITLLLGLSLALPFFFSFGSAVGSSMVSDLNYTTITELQSFHSWNLDSILSQSKFSVVIFWLLMIFFVGGIVHTFNLEDYSVGTFFSGAGVNYFRFLLCDVIMIAAQAVSAAALFGIASFVLSLFNSEISETPLFWAYGIAGFIFACVIVLLLMISDYAKFYMEMASTSRVLKAIGKATKFVFNNFVRSYFLYALLLVAPLLTLVLYKLTFDKIGMSTAFGIIAMFFVQQIFILLRVWFRVWSLSSQFELYADEYVQVVNYDLDVTKIDSASSDSDSWGGDNQPTDYSDLADGSNGNSLLKNETVAVIETNPEVINSDGDTFVKIVDEEGNAIPSQLNYQHPDDDIKVEVSDNQHPDDDIKVEISDNQHPDDDIKVEISDNQHPDDDIKVEISDNQHPDDDIKVEVFDNQQPDDDIKVEVFDNQQPDEIKVVIPANQQPDDIKVEISENQHPDEIKVEVAEPEIEEQLSKFYQQDNSQGTECNLADLTPKQESKPKQTEPSQTAVIAEDSEVKNGGDSSIKSDDKKASDAQELSILGEPVDSDSEAGEEQPGEVAYSEIDANDLQDREEEIGGDGDNYGNDEISDPGDYRSSDDIDQETLEHFYANGQNDAQEPAPASSDPVEVVDIEDFDESLGSAVPLDVPDDDEQSVTTVTTTVTTTTTTVETSSNASSDSKIRKIYTEQEMREIARQQLESAGAEPDLALTEVVPDDAPEGVISGERVEDYAFQEYGLADGEDANDPDSEALG